MSNKHKGLSFQDMLDELKKSKPKAALVEVREERRYFLIVSEGIKTEPKYFKFLAEQLPENLVDTIEVDGAGADTIRVVEKAISLRDARKKQKGLPQYDEVWAVFDKDDFPDQNFHAAIQLAARTGINSGHSNQSFELWYILHFEYLNSALHRDDYSNKLSEHLKVKYTKNQVAIAKKIYEEGNHKLAVRRAKKLDNIHQESGVTPSKSCPMTKVYILFDRLQAYIENRMPMY